MNTKDYIRFTDGQSSCLVCLNKPTHHHLEAVGMGNDRKRQTIKDYSCIPLCINHHNELHGLGMELFEQKYRINLWKEAFQLLRRYFLGVIRLHCVTTGKKIKRSQDDIQR